MHSYQRRIHIRRRAGPHSANMTSNRPFFSNFLAAFRAQSAIQKSGGSPSAAAAAGAYAQHASASHAGAGTSTKRTITTTTTTTTKTSPPSPGLPSTTVQVQPPTTASKGATPQFQPTRQHATSYTRRSTSPTAKAFPIPSRQDRSRRGSDSSSEGFHEVVSGEKWYIGGRTAAGEERFYRLGMVRSPRERSADRLSCDRLSI
jgi:hypothetical protein